MARTKTAQQVDEFKNELNVMIDGWALQVVAFLNGHKIAKWTEESKASFVRELRDLVEEYARDNAVNEKQTRYIFGSREE